MKHVRRNLTNLSLVIAFLLAAAMFFSPQISTFITSATTGIHMQAPASFYVDEQVRIDVWSGSHDVQLVVVDPAGIKRGCAEVLLERDHEVCIVDMSGGIIPGPHTAMLYKDGYLLQDLIFMVEIRQTLEKPKKITEVDVTIEVNGTEKVEVNITESIELNITKEAEVAEEINLNIMKQLADQVVEISSDNITLVDCTNTTVLFDINAVGSALHSSALKVNVLKKQGARVKSAKVKVDCVSGVTGTTDEFGLLETYLVKKIETEKGVEPIEYCTVSACKNDKCDSKIIGTGNRTVGLYLDI